MGRSGFLLVSTVDAITMKRRHCGGSKGRVRGSGEGGGLWTRIFNMVLRRGERTSETISRVLVEEFKITLENLDLVDLPLTGGKWTWTNQRSCLL